MQEGKKVLKSLPTMPFYKICTETVTEENFCFKYSPNTSVRMATIKATEDKKQPEITFIFLFAIV